MTISLGGVVFEAFEVPAAITFGGSQRISIQSLPGGGRVIDAMGPDDANITWSGVLSGASASSRARQLDGMRSAGNPIMLQWQSFSYLVVVEHLRLKLTKPWWIQYAISCAVLPALTQPAFSNIYFEQQVLADMSSAASYFDVSDLTAAVVTAQTSPGVAALSTLAVKAVGLMRDIGGQIAASGTVLDSGNATINDLVTQAGVQASLVTGRAYLERAIATQNRVF